MHILKFIGSSWSDSYAIGFNTCEHHRLRVLKSLWEVLKLQLQDWYVCWFFQRFAQLSTDSRSSRWSEVYGPLQTKLRYDMMEVICLQWRMGIQELKEDLECKVSLIDLPEINQFLDCIWKCPWSVVQDRFMDDYNECPPMGLWSQMALKMLPSSRYSNLQSLSVLHSYTFIMSNCIFSSKIWSSPLLRVTSRHLEGLWRIVLPDRISMHLMLGNNRFQMKQGASQEVGCSKPGLICTELWRSQLFQGDKIRRCIKCDGWLWLWTADQLPLYQLLWRQTADHLHVGLR
jgi:hypothetical protein